MIVIVKKITTRSIRQSKGQQPIVAVTAYDAITARLADEAGVDILLVGDSVGTTHLGFTTTVPVTIEMLLHHAQAVMRAQPNALVVVDIPFGVAHRSFDQLLAVCVQCLQDARVDAVKIEGGSVMAAKVAGLVAAGIPVLGHIGLLPQHVNELGGYRKFGHNSDERAALIADAQALARAGAFALVGEMIVADCAGEIARSIDIPLIGIGSGNACDGQILVSTDLMGMNLGSVPSFVKVYANVKQVMQDALHAYVKEVRGREFPPEQVKD